MDAAPIASHPNVIERICAFALPRGVPVTARCQPKPRLAASAKLAQAMRRSGSIAHNQATLK
jgi:hypothetical protein